MSSAKVDLRRYLQSVRDALLWKLEGLSEYHVRRPVVPTGTNLLGVVKHVARTEAGYLGDCFGRPYGEPLPWMSDEAEHNAPGATRRGGRATATGWRTSPEPPPAS